MQNRTVGFVALGCLVAAGIPFWLRMSNIITTSRADETAYHLAAGLFVLFFGLAIIFSIGFVGRWVFGLTRRWIVGARWAVSIAVSTVLLFGEASLFLTGCLAINFVGQ